ncbi:MAG: response regulator [Chthoniobacterales bacterium]
MTFLKKILLVDYEPRVTALVKKALEETGRYEIKEEHDSRQAMNAAKWFRPDLILFDVNPSAAHDEEAARELRADPAFQDTPVVFLSVNGASQESVVSAGILSGYSFMANPIRIEDFVGYVGEILKVPADLVRAGYHAVTR